MNARPYLYGTVTLAALLAALVALFGRQIGGAEDSVIGVVPIEGVIWEADSVLWRLREMRDMEAVKGVILELDSPGGGVAPSQEIHQAVMELRQSKPVYAAIRGMAASGAYYVAVAADRVYSTPGAITGSIGVILEWANAKGLSEKIGVEPRLIKSGANKDIMNMFGELAPGQRDLLQALVDDTHGQFVEAVRAGRPKMDPERVAELADGRIFSGRQAAELGLVDELGTASDALDAMAEELGLEDAPTLELENFKEGVDSLLGTLNPGNWSLFGARPPVGGVRLNYLLM